MKNNRPVSEWTKQERLDWARCERYMQRWESKLVEDEKAAALYVARVQARHRTLGVDVDGQGHQMLLELERDEAEKKNQLDTIAVLAAVLGAVFVLLAARAFSDGVIWAAGALAAIGSFFLIAAAERGKRARA